MSEPEKDSEGFEIHGAAIAPDACFETLDPQTGLHELVRDGEVVEQSNASGIVPTRFCVLVKPDPEPDVTKGGIMLPPQYRDQRQTAAVTGRVIDIADEAFSFISEPFARRPKIGDRVAFTKYAGSALIGADKQVYKLMNDEDISGVLEFEPL